MYKFLLAMIVVMGLSGCITMPDGGSQPDYELIEIGSMASMSMMIINVKASDQNVVAAHARLRILYNTLSCVPSVKTCPPFQLVMLEGMIANALPPEYQPLTVSMVRLIKSRANLYLDERLPDSENIEIIRKVAATVVGGMVQALEPKVLQIQSRG